MGEYKKKSDVLKQYKNVLVIFLKKKKKKDRTKIPSYNSMLS